MLFIQDPEKVHDSAVAIGRFFGFNLITRAATKFFFNYQHPMLEQNIAGIRFRNPIGLAAGFDKDAQLTSILSCVGFGFEEIGSITGEYCAGNPKPRLWRIPRAEAIIVYYGLKNEGAEYIASKLENRSFPIPIGVSAAKTNSKETIHLRAGIEDYMKVIRTFRNIGAYYTINISCPNSFGGEDFVDTKKMIMLFNAMKKEKLFHKPVFIKISPDMSVKRLDAIISLSIKYNVTGLISANLIKKREHAKTLTKDELATWKKGGLSGKPVKAYALKQVQYIFKKAGKKLVIIGCGGINSAEDAYEYICSGASLVQLITGMIYEGPQLIGEINRGLVDLLKKDGFSNISEAVGSKVYS